MEIRLGNLKNILEERNTNSVSRKIIRNSLLVLLKINNEI